jgi:Transposase DDE domain
VVPYPARETHRTTFTPQAANLWALKEKLRKELLDRIGFDTKISLIDGSPLAVCRFARAYRCRRLAEQSAFGYDEMTKQTFYGLRAHLRVCWPGVIVEMDLAPANVHDPRMAEELPLEGGGVKGWALGDRNYHGPNLAEQPGRKGVSLPAPYEFESKEREPWPRWLVQKRRRIETVISRLVDRYQAKKVWARDRWHLTSRFLRKVLSHTVAVFLCQEADLPPLRFSELLAD